MRSGAALFDCYPVPVAQAPAVKKSRAICILLATVALLGGWAAWSAWEPAPTLMSMTFDSNVTPAARSAAEADFRAHPPRARKLTWSRFLDRLVHPYQHRGPQSIRVSIIPHTDGGRLLSIGYPRGRVFLAPHRDNVTWGRAYAERAEDLP